MVVYWDMAALWNFALDYLLLLGTVRLAGRGVHRARLAAAAALGAASSVAMLTLPFSPWLLVGSMLLMCFAAFGGEARKGKLTLLFCLLACGLGGAVLLLGQFCGGTEHLAKSLLFARLPWGVFFAATGLSYLLFSTVFRGSAKHGKKDHVRVRVVYGGRSVEARLLRDTGNALSDPLTGEGVPVLEKKLLEPLLEGGNGVGAAYKGFTTLHCRTVGGGEIALEAFRCDALTVDGRDLGARLIALSPEAFGSGYQGLWYDDEKEEEKRHELEAAMGQNTGAV